MLSVADDRTPAVCLSSFWADRSLNVLELPNILVFDGVAFRLLPAFPAATPYKFEPIKVVLEY